MSTCWCNNSSNWRRMPISSSPSSTIRAHLQSPLRRGAALTPDHGRSDSEKDGEAADVRKVPGGRLVAAERVDLEPPAPVLDGPSPVQILRPSAAFAGSPAGSPDVSG